MFLLGEGSEAYRILWEGSYFCFNLSLSLGNVLRLDRLSELQKTWSAGRLLLLLPVLA